MIGYTEMREMLEQELEELSNGPPWIGARPIESLGIYWEVAASPRTDHTLPGAVLDLAVGWPGTTMDQMSEDNYGDSE